MRKIELPMPHYDTEQAVGHMDMITGDCAFFHKKGKYWSYAKYSKDEVLDILVNSDSVTYAKPHRVSIWRNLRIYQKLRKFNMLNNMSRQRQ